MYPPIVIDLRLLTYAEQIKPSKKDYEQEHQRLHREHKAHIHLDGSHDSGG